MEKKITLDASLRHVINLLSDIVVFNQYDFGQFLQKLIKIIIEIIPADSCFIYFYDKNTKQLILVGSKKPHIEELDHISMREGEGITGWVAQHEQTVTIEKNAYHDERFKPFEELPEDKYESFLSVPISNETGVVGVINLQNKKPYTFSSEQIKALESLVKIISSAFVKIVLERKVTKLETQLEERKVIEKAKGILMREKNLTEDKAFTFIRNEAMNKRKSMKEIADAIILVLDK